MRLGIVSELFKHVPVHLKRLHKLWLCGKQFARLGQIIPTCFLSGKSKVKIFLINVSNFVGVSTYE